MENNTHVEVKIQYENDHSKGLACKRPMSTPDRLIIPFYPMAGCCGSSCSGNGNTGIEIAFETSPPMELLDAGVDPEEWEQWMMRLDDEVQDDRMSMCTFTMLAMLILPIPYLCMETRNYNRRLGLWLEDFNDEFLSRYGLYATTQTAMYDADQYHEEISWLAIALTREEAEVLRSEPHIWATPCCGDEIKPHWSCCQSCLCEPRMV